MRREAMTKKQLIAELHELRQFTGELLNIPPDVRAATDLKRFKQAFQSMWADQEKYKKSFLQNAIPMCLTTPKDGCFVEVSEALLRLLRFERTEVIGKTLISLGIITEEQRATVLSKLNRRGRIENFEIQVKAKNGKSIDGLLNIVLMTLGKEKYLLTTMADITKLKLEAQARRMSGQRHCHLPIDQPMPWYIG